MLRIDASGLSGVLFSIGCGDNQSAAGVTDLTPLGEDGRFAYSGDGDHGSVGDTIIAVTDGDGALGSLGDGWFGSGKKSRVFACVLTLLLHGEINQNKLCVALRS